VILKILYDNEAPLELRSGWGFSCLVDEHLLFDPGANADTLLFNMQKLHVNLERIDKMVLSHSHRDHVGGIGIVNELPKVQIFVPKSFSKRFKKDLHSLPHVELIEVDKMMQIQEGIFTTGEVRRRGLTKEQSLIVQTGKGLTQVTGCSHQGLDKVIKVVSKLGAIYRVVGGFHGFSQLEILKDYGLIVPCHRTSKKKELLTLYPITCKQCAVGCTFKI
jgi:7,8-dihydropterin-6-yl-methyl-4-(beta-D-ribofuranosyl)aminobenzene 5'-phosphate synthase